MNPRRARQEKSAVELAEEAFHLLRCAPGDALACYAAGTLPFVLASLYFVADMSRHAFAGDRLVAGSLGLAMLFVIMKCSQAMFASRLTRLLAGEPPVRGTGLRLVRMGAQQAFLHAMGLLLLPIALLLLLPFGWTYAFFASVTVFGAENEPSWRALWRRAWSQAWSWPKQNHYALGIFKLLYLVVFLNLTLAGFLVPQLLKSLLGIESAFTISPLAMFNTTFLTVCAGLTYLCVDPFVKTAYVLRCFYSESQKSGRDLRAELKQSVNLPVGENP